MVGRLRAHSRRLEDTKGNSTVIEAQVRSRFVLTKSPVPTLCAIDVPFLAVELIEPSFRLVHFILKRYNMRKLTPIEPKVWKINCDAP